MLAFTINTLCSLLMLTAGIYPFFSKKPMAKFKIIKEHIDAYNKEFGRLFCIYALIIFMFGIPFLMEKQDELYMVIYVLAIFLSSMAVVFYYSLKIEPKYNKR